MPGKRIGQRERPERVPRWNGRIGTRGKEPCSAGPDGERPVRSADRLAEETVDFLAQSGDLQGEFGDGGFKSFDAAEVYG